MRINPRPMPEGFAADAYEMAFNDLKVKYRAGTSAVKRWRREVAGPPQGPLPPPDDFLWLAESLCRRQLGFHYRVGFRQIETWVRETGASPRNGRESRPEQRRKVPDDFLEIAPGLTRNLIKDHYRTNEKAVARWLLETGITPAAYTAPGKLPRYYRVPGQSNVTVLRNYGPQDEAADILRCHMPVYRCDERGRFDQKGKLWRVGNVTVDGDELLVRAARYRSKAA